jgi:hypothetical protein
MARFQKLFGGIELAGSGQFKNLVVEQLDKDPVVQTAGRIWFNTTDKVFKCSVLETVENDDGTTSEKVVIRIIGSAEDLSNFIDRLKSTDAGEGSALVGFSGETGPNGKFSVPAEDLETALKAIVDGIDANAKAVEDAEAAASDAVNAVQSELDKTQAGAGLGDDGSYTANANANYIADATSLADADNKLDAAVKSLADKEAADIADTKAYVDDNFLNKTTTDEQTVNGPVNFASDVYVKGNLTVSGGTVTEIETEQLKVGDNIITLNADVPADVSPTENAGIEINRGSEGVMPFLIWDETNDVAKVVAGKDADGNWVLAPIATGGDADEIKAELDKTQAGAGLADDGSYVANTIANYIADAASLADADNKLDAALKSLADKEAADVENINNTVSALQSEVDAVEAGAGLGEDGSYVANTNANYIANATSLADADNKLDAAVKANADAITQEVNDRKAADNALQSELDNTQTGAGLAADGSYVANESANYIANATSLADADNKLDVAIKTVSDNVAAAQTDLSTLKTNLNGTRVTFEATDAATSYTITHNLGSQFVDVMIWVYDDNDGKWYNDQVVVSVVDDNTIQVDLTAAAKIRATIVNVAFEF